MHIVLARGECLSAFAPTSPSVRELFENYTESEQRYYTWHGTYAHSTMCVCMQWRVVCMLWRVVCMQWRVVCMLWRVVCMQWRVVCMQWRMVCTQWRVACTQWRMACTQ